MFAKVRIVMGMTLGLLVWSHSPATAQFREPTRSNAIDSAWPIPTVTATPTARPTARPTAKPTAKPTAAATPQQPGPAAREPAKDARMEAQISAFIEDIAEIRRQLAERADSVADDSPTIRYDPLFDQNKSADSDSGNKDDFESALRTLVKQRPPTPRTASAPEMPAPAAPAAPRYNEVMRPMGVARHRSPADPYAITLQAACIQLGQRALELERSKDFEGAQRLRRLARRLRSESQAMRRPGSQTSPTTR